MNTDGLDRQEKSESSYFLRFRVFRVFRGQKSSRLVEPRNTRNHTKGCAGPRSETVHDLDQTPAPFPSVPFREIRGFKNGFPDPRMIPHPERFDCQSTDSGPKLDQLFSTP